MTRWSLGVDVGSGWVAGATTAPGAPPALLVVGGDRRVPTTVVLTEDGRLLAGAAAQRASGRLPDRAERDPRRYVGRSPMLLGGSAVAAGDALAALLALFVTEGRRRHDDRDPVRLALTHPAGWGPDRLAVVRDAAGRVVPGADVLLVPEPVAVAAHAGVAGPAAVVDVGATSLDVAVVVAGVPERVGSDPDLGGELFDQLVLRAFGEQLAHAAPQWWREVSGNPDRAWLAAAADLAEEARLAREALTDLDVTTRYVPGADADVRLTRAELDALLDDDVRRGVRLVARSVEGPGATPGSVLVAGGTGVTPIVLAGLRERFGEQVRLVDDPQGAAALGAAGLAGRTGPATPEPAASRPPAGRPAAPRSAAPGPAAPGGVRPGAVVDAQVVDGRLYTWTAADDGTHRLARSAAPDARPDRETGFDRVVGWAVTPAGLLVCERRSGGDLVCHVLDPDLRLTAQVPLPTRYRPHLVAAGAAGWAVLRSPDTRMTPGPGTGEVGTLAVQAFRFGAAPGPVQALGPALYRYTAPDRLLLDPSAPGTGAPRAGAGGCTVVVGRPDGARQVVWSVGADGPPARRADRRAGPWLQQAGGAPGRSWSTGAAGWEEQPAAGAPGRLVLPAPPGGVATRLGRGLALTTDRPDGRGATLHAVGGAGVLGRWAAAAGSPVAARAAGAVAARTDGDGVLLGVVRTDGRGAVVRADHAGVRELGSAPGRLEPVGRLGDVVLARTGDVERPGELIVLT